MTIARTLAAEFQARAAEYDRTGQLPSENYQRMRETGYLRAGVPIELGGLGAGLLELSRAQQALARGCASTALAVNMHQFQVGSLVDGWRSGKPAEPMLRRIADEGIVLASTNAEMLVAGAWTTSTVAHREGDGYRISGRKFFCSQATGMDVVRVAALEPETSEILVFSVPGKAEGLTVVETWDTTGMRATASHDVVLDGVQVPASAVSARLSPDGPLQHPALAGLATWFLSLLSGVYLGIAEEARAVALASLGRGRNGAFRDQALTDVLIGELETGYLIAVSTRDQVVGLLDRDRSDVQASFGRAVLCREVVLSHAMAVVDKAVELTGGSAFFRKSPLERLARDVRAARFHPPSAPVSYQVVGQRVRA